jgi:hypothetical protein
MNVRRVLLLLAVVLMPLTLACGGEDSQSDQQVEEVTGDVVEEVVETTAPVMTEEEMMIADVMAKCICPQCPSWIPEAAEKGEGGYCAVGVSECIVDEVGCICPDCPVTAEKGLMWGYYCTRGSAEEMMNPE